MVALGYIAAADTEIPCGLVTLVKSMNYDVTVTFVKVECLTMRWQHAMQTLSFERKVVVYFLHVIDCAFFSHRFAVSFTASFVAEHHTRLEIASINHRHTAADPTLLNFRRRELRLLPYISTSVSSFIPRNSCRRRRTSRHSRRRSSSLDPARPCRPAINLIKPHILLMEAVA